MKNFFTKNLYAILVSALCVLIAVISVFSMLGSAAPNTFYKTGGYDTDVYSAAAFKVNLTKDEYLDSVWVNIGSIDYTKGTEKVVLEVGRASTTKMDFSRRKTVELANTKEGVMVGEWQLLYEYETESSKNITTPYFLISTKNAIAINEVVFLTHDIDGKNLAVASSVEGYGSGFKGTTSVGSSSATWWQELEGSTLDITAEGKAAANKLVDESSTFSVSNIGASGGNRVYTQKYALNDYEQGMLESVKNVIYGESGYISADANPIGLFIMSIGVILFGGGKLGLRIMPALATIGSVILVYLIAKRFFKEKRYSLLVAVLYAIGGYATSYATVGSLDAILTFFVLLSFYFAIKFMKKDINKASGNKVYLGILLSGLSFALALGVKSHAIVFAPVILFTIFYSIFKKNNEEVKLDKTVAVTVTVVSFVIISLIVIVLGALLAFNTLASVYATESVFALAFKHFVAPFSINGNHAAGFIINLYGEEFGAGKYALGNIIISALAIVAVIYLTVETFKLVGANEQGKNYALPIYYAVGVTGFIISWALCIITGGSLGVYGIANIFAILLIVIALRRLSMKSNKTLFNSKESVVSVSWLAVLALAIASFALTIPAIYGLSVSPSLFAINAITLF